MPKGLCTTLISVDKPLLPQSAGAWSERRSPPPPPCFAQDAMMAAAGNIIVGMARREDSIHQQDCLCRGECL